MLAKGAHFGYSSSKSHPKMKTFVFANRNGVDIFDLEKTQNKLKFAKDFVKEVGQEQKLILFVGTKKEAKSVVAEVATGIDMPFVNERWLGGIITNFSEIKKRLNHLEDLISKMAKGEFAKNTKLERLRIDEEIEKMKRFFSGMSKLKSLPGALIVIDSEKEKIAVAEARKANIPVVALMSSDCNPSEIDYIIPANDSSVDSITYFMNEIAISYKEGFVEGTKKAEDKAKADAEISDKEKVKEEVE